jgi:hypothetical protein
MKSPCQLLPAVALFLAFAHPAVTAWAARPANRVPQQPAIPAAERPTVEHFPNALAAFQKVLDISARVVAIGEYHQTTSTVAIRSSLSRFADELLPALAQAATDLVVETWVATGACGAQEKKVEKEIETTTERPPETENEIITLLRRAKAKGMEPHILVMSCKDYRFVTDKRGETDFAKMLRLTRDRLQAEVIRWLAAPPTRAGNNRRTVAIYGGALHNDLYPAAADKPYAFGPALFSKAKGDYVEVDLFVPEYIVDDQRLASEPWFRLFQQNQDAKDAVLIRRSERSFVILFPPSKDPGRLDGRPRGPGSTSP